MISYYGYTISPNQIETGEGFLICRNVPIARTGDQKYLGSEIGMTGKDSGKVVIVHRPPEEVFSDAAIASFEGKPVTNDHPPDLIGPDDVEIYGKGHVEVVRKGTGEWNGYLIGDVHIHSRELIEAVKNGKREISCGYSCEYEDNGDGTYTQRNIRGNHVAVVDRGRAGKRAAILDSKIIEPAEKTARKENNMKRKALLKFFGMAAKDRTPEEIEEMAMDAEKAIAESDAAEEEPVVKDPAPADDKELQMDEAILDKLAERVMEKMKTRQAAEEDKDPMQEMIEKLAGEAQTGNGVDTEETHVVPAEEMDKICGMDSAMAAAILKTMQPAVASIQDVKQRNAVADALIQCVTTKDGDIAKLVQAAQKAAKNRAQDASAINIDAIQASYDALNPHRRRKETE